jgi:hypothetical protein
VGDNLQMVPVITSLLAVLEVVNEFVESPLSDVAARRTEPKVLEISLGGNVEAEQTGVVTEDHTNDLPKALKRGILSALTSTRKLLKKRSGQFLKNLLMLGLLGKQLLLKNTVIW